MKPCVYPSRSPMAVAAALACAVLALGVPGCASPAHEHFYTVARNGIVPEPVTAEARVAVWPVRIPALVDRPQLVAGTGEHEVTVLEHQRWAQPLSQDLTHALVDELRREPNGLAAFESNGGVRQTDALSVEVRIDDLLSTPAGTSLSASWTVRNARQNCSESGALATRLAAAKDNERIATAYAQAMSRLAQAVAATVRQAGPCNSPRDARN